MSFLQSSDYKKVIPSDYLDAIVQQDQTILDDAELAAQAEMESYLNNRFDVGAIFSKTGTDRNPILVMHLVDIVIYHVHSRISPDSIPQLRADRYDKAIDWLMKVSRGQITPDLPMLDYENDPNSFIKHGSHPRQSNYW